MTDDRNLRRHIREEADEIMFSHIRLSEEAKRTIRRQAAEDPAGRRFARRKSWTIGSAALAAAVLIFAGYALLEQPSVPAEPPVATAPPSGGGAAGSDLSRLISTPIGSPEEAKAAFGEGLRLPTEAPEGYTLSEIVAVGEQGKPARDVIFAYASGENVVTFVASRSPAAFPAELFSPTQVNGVDGFVYAQSGMTELFWMADGVQYSVTGPISAEAAMAVAESVGT